MAHDYKKITKQFGFSYLSNIMVFIFSFIAIVLLTRVLSVAEYGVYSILSATVAVLSVVLTLGLNQYVVTKLSGIKYFDRIKSMASVIALELVILIPILTFLFIPKIQNIILYYLKLTSYVFEFNLSIIIIFVCVVFSLILSYLTANRKIEFHSFILFIYKSLWIFLIIIFFLLFKRFNLQIVFILWFIGISISLIVLLIYLKKDIFFFFKKIRILNIALFKKALSFSLPLIMLLASSWIITVADRYMINYFKDSALTGIYSLSYSLVSMILSFAVIITSVLYPYIAKAWSEKKDHNILFNAMLKYNIIIILPAMVGLFVLREQIITLVSGTEYILGAPTIAILITFPLFAALINIYTHHLLLREKTRLIAFVYLLGAILNIILNLFMIPSYGINGAAISTVASYIFMFILFYIISKGQFSWNLKFLRIKRMAFASVLMGIVLALMNPQIYLTKIMSIILGVIIYVFLLFILQIFVKEEHKIMKSFLPKSLKKFLI